MGKSLLAWTLYGPLDEDTSLSDPLGLDYFAQLLGNVILPSFTTRTGRARYYSMVSYGLYISRKYLEENGKVFREKDILEAFKLYERYWARAVVEYYSGELGERDGKEREFRGKRGAIQAYKNKETTLKFKLLTRQIELGGLGAYKTSMESLEILKADLALTQKGLNLAKSFLDTKYYDKMILQAMNNEKIVIRSGNQTLYSLGEKSRLDASINLQENRFIQEYIINDPKNVIAISLIYNNMDLVRTKNPIDIVEVISNTLMKTDEGKTVVDGFRTILEFENLAIIINRIWCSIIRSCKENMGRSSIQDIVEEARPYLENLQVNKYIDKLVASANYRNIKEGLHGNSFDILLRQFLNFQDQDYQGFIIELLKYHGSVMKRRNSSPWMSRDSEDILVFSGYEYPDKSEKLKFLHGYKIYNIINIIEDTRWKPSNEIY